MEDLELQEMQIPFIETNRAPPLRERFEEDYQKAAVIEGEMRHRLLKEAESGGVLSEERLSIYQEDEQPEPPQQYGHHDHLTAHAIFLRALQVREKAAHRSLAKKLANEAVEKWKARNGPTEEDMIAERNKMMELIKKQVVVDMRGKWEMVETYVRERKKRAWEVEQERLRAKKLQQKLEWSENLLAKQRGEAESDVEEEEGDVEEESEEDENMSDDEEEEDDEEMDDDALAGYLAQREVEPPDKELEEEEEPQRAQTRMNGSPMRDEVTDDLSSDESTDMDSEDMSDDTEASEEDRQPFRNSLLALYDAKELLKEREGGLPTPMTSVENGGDNDNPRPQSEVRSDLEDELQTVDEPEDSEAAYEPGDSQAAYDDDVENPEAPPKDTPRETPEETSSKHLIPSPLMLRGTLRSYQHAGMDWLASLYRNGTNGILADEMGLGKTIQTIALLAHLAEVHEIWETHLIIVPTSVILNWVTEFQKFLPGFRVLGYYGTADERQFKRKGWTNDPHHEDKTKRGYNVVITSYTVAMQDINAIRGQQWHYLILDEAHNIRNFNSQRWQLLIRLRTRARLLLTGTPLQNDLAEVWSLLTFLTAGDDDKSHGELEEFLGHWKDPVKEIFDQGVQKISENAQRVVEQLHISLRPFLLRRKKIEVEKDLPKKTEKVVVCKLSKRQRQLYQDYMGLAETRQTLAKGSGIQTGAVLLSLRRVCNHPDLFDPRPIQTSFAMEYSPLEWFNPVERMIRRMLGIEEDVPRRLKIVKGTKIRKSDQDRFRALTAVNQLKEELHEREKSVKGEIPNPTTVWGARALQRYQSRQRKLEQLRSCITATESSLMDTPMIPLDLREMVTIHRGKVGNRPMRLGHPIDWYVTKSTKLQQDVATKESYSEMMEDIIVRFAFVPPAVTVPILDYTIPVKTQRMVRSSPLYPTNQDYGHEARIRTTIAFPDKRLLIYDSGKLQRLTHLLRELQSRGSRSLIFTQMTGTLNILEQFLSLMNLPYLRLDGSTPVERRQLYSAEFNRPDSRYQCMILSSRAGGVGLNLTGASSVIFYDLDWNPQMDRQCMDRAHRIGQVRDVEVYKMVSEKTVEENILRRANQKSLLDETVIQGGHFTTEYQPKKDDTLTNAVDRFLGDDEKSAAQALASVEDQEDVQAAQKAGKEDGQEEVSSRGASKANTPGIMVESEEESMMGHVDGYMIRYMQHLLKDWNYSPPQSRLDKTGRDRSHRPRKRR
jgi:helicase SWR1